MSELMSSPHQLPNVADVYTDLSGLQKLRAGDDKDAALKQVAKQFESMFISLMLKSMRSANDVFAEGNMFDSNESKFYRDMHDQQLSLSMAHSKGLGIAESMYRQMSRSYGTAESSDNIGAKKDLEYSERLLPHGIGEKLKGIMGGDDHRSAFASSPRDFIQKVAPAAKNAAKALGLHPVVLVAQAALETGWGEKVLSTKDGSLSFNLFNIKASKNWKGDSVQVESAEYRAGRRVTELSNFRKYDSVEKSFSDYVDFLKTNPRYKDALAATDDAETFIKALHQAGYATDPNYSQKVIDVMRRLESSGSEHSGSLSKYGSPVIDGGEK